MSLNSKIPVIIDTDPGVDDVLAILLALASPELEVLAIIVSYGNTDLDSCWKNIFRLYEVLAIHFEKYPDERARFPNFAQVRRTVVARGCDRPLKGDIHTAQYFHGRDGLGDISSRHSDLEFEGTECQLSHPQLEVSIKPGTEVVLDILRAQEPRSVTYIALGPLTNLALMMRKDPVTVRGRLGRICCMGGALDVPGNATPVAEFNFYADPYAVHELLTPEDPTRGFPLERFVLLPLDITTPHELSFPLYSSKVDNSFNSTAFPSDPNIKPLLRHFTSSFLEKTREIMLYFGKDALELHDLVAVWCAIENPPDRQELPHGPILQQGWKFVRRQFQIERAGELTRGMVVVDRRSDQGAYTPGENRPHHMLDELGVELHQGFASTAVPAQVQVEDYKGIVLEGGGVATVVQTPGPDAVVGLLLKRIWGVE